MIAFGVILEVELMFGYRMSEKEEERMTREFKVIY